MAVKKQRVGQPLRTDPADFPRLPPETGVLNAELNALLVRSGLTHKQMAQMVGITDKQCSRQLGENPGGPSNDLFDAIVHSAAAALGESREALRAEFVPKLAAARGAAAAIRQKTSWGRSATIRQTHAKAERERLLTQKTRWLLLRLCDAEEQKVAEQLDEVFPGDEDLLAQALVQVGDREPGAVAALLDKVRKQHGQSRSTALLAAITDLDQEVGRRISLIPLPKAVPEPTEEPSILEMSGTQLFGRRVAALISKGHTDQARREVAARVDREPLDATDSILGAIITSRPDDGPDLVNTLLHTMAEPNPAQMLTCVIQILRCPHEQRLLLDMERGLSPALRSLILMQFSRSDLLPNVHSLDNDGLRDLVTFVEALRCNTVRLATALVEEWIPVKNLSAGYLLQAITDFGPVLAQITATRLNRTTALLAQALQDWDTRTGIPTPPDWYPPVLDLAHAVLCMTSGIQLTGELLRDYPENGTLLFAAIQGLDHDRFPAFLAGLVGNHAFVDALAGMFRTSNDLRLLRIFERLLIQAPKAAKPILHVAMTHHIGRIKALLPQAQQRAPHLYDQVRELLGDEETQPVTSDTSSTDAAPRSLATLDRIAATAPDFTVSSGLVAPPTYSLLPSPPSLFPQHGRLHWEIYARREVSPPLTRWAPRPSTPSMPTHDPRATTPDTPDPTTAPRTGEGLIDFSDQAARRRTYLQRWQRPTAG